MPTKCIISNSSTRPWKGAAGQVTVETALMFLAVLAALVVLGQVYTQRAMQGYTFEANQSLSTPFNPASFGDSTSGTTSESATIQMAHSMFEARLLKVKPADYSEESSQWEDTMTMSSLPTGPVPREPAVPLAMQVTTTWNGSQSASTDVPLR